MQHAIVSEQQWLEARKALLAKEKEFSRARDELNRQRRALPWVRVDKNYVFDGPQGPVALTNLFGGKSQLLIYHFMLGPSWAKGCPSCSFLADHFDGATIHLAQRDVTLVVVSRAPLPEIEAYRRRMGWQFPWVSSHGNGFNFDYHVSFTPDEQARGEANYNYSIGKFPSEEAPGISAFIKDETGAVFHTYSAYARGLDTLIGTYNFLDMAPNGRDEDSLPWTMAWVRRHDEYESAPVKPAAACCD